MTTANEKIDRGNVALLAGYLAGLLSTRDGEVYRLLDIEPETGVLLIEALATGNQYRVAVEAIGNAEP